MQLDELFWFGERNNPASPSRLRNVGAAQALIRIARKHPEVVREALA